MLGTEIPHRMGREGAESDVPSIPCPAVRGYWSEPGCSAWASVGGSVTCRLYDHISEPFLTSFSTRNTRKLDQMSAETFASSAW